MSLAMNAWEDGDTLLELHSDQLRITPDLITRRGREGTATLIMRDVMGHQPEMDIELTQDEVVELINDMAEIVGLEVVIKGVDK